MCKTKRRVSIKLTSLDKVNEVLSNFDNGEVELFLYVEDCPKSYKILSRNPYIEDWDFIEENKKESPTTDIKEEDTEVVDTKEDIKPITEVVDIKEEEPVKEEEPIKEVVEPVKEERQSRVVKKSKPAKSTEEVTEDLMEKIKQEYLNVKASDLLAKEELISNDDGSGDIELPDINVRDMMDLARVIEASWRLVRKTPSTVFNTSLFRSQVEKEYKNLVELESNDSNTSFSDKTTRAVSRLLLGVYYNNPKSKEGVDAAYLDTMKKIGDNYDSLKCVETLNKVMNILYRHEEN